MGENHQDKTPYGSAFKTWASRSVLQFQSEGYDKDTGILDLRIRHKKTNFGPQLDPFGASVAFEDAKVSFEVRELSTEELVGERSRPSTQRILEALEGGDKTAQE